jgi:hypothetical protein
MQRILQQRRQLLARLEEIKLNKHGGIAMTIKSTTTKLGGSKVHVLTAGPDDGQPGYPYYADDLGLLRGSVAKLLEFGATKFYVGHGGPIESGRVRAWLEREQAAEVVRNSASKESPTPMYQRSGRLWMHARPPLVNDISSRIIGERLNGVPESPIMPFVVHLRGVGLRSVLGVSRDEASIQRIVC